MTRQAADLLGATKMDRPAADKANPRPNNHTGHIIEVTQAGDDPAATTFNWGIFMLRGNPKREDASKPETQTYFAGFDKTRVSPIGAPDNLTFGVIVLQNNDTEKRIGAA